MLCLSFEAFSEFFVFLGGTGGGAEGSGSDFSPEGVMESSNTFGDDMLQMALKMATELEEPHVDVDIPLTNQGIF